MNDMPCGGDSWTNQRTEYQGSVAISHWIPKHKGPGCPGCAHAVENGGKCCEGDAEWARAIGGAKCT